MVAPRSLNTPRLPGQAWPSPEHSGHVCVMSAYMCTAQAQAGSFLCIEWWDLRMVVGATVMVVWDSGRGVGREAVPEAGTLPRVAPQPTRAEDSGVEGTRPWLMSSTRTYRRGVLG